MNKRYTDNTKRPEPKSCGNFLSVFWTQGSLLNFPANLHILPENLADSLGSRRVLLGLSIYLGAYTKKVAATLLGGASRGAVGA